MGRQRREFAPEYKDEAVKLAINTGRPVAVVARKMSSSLRHVPLRGLYEGLW